MTYSEFFTSHFFKPVRSLVRIVEDGEFFNIISSNIYGTISYFIPIIFIFSAYIISDGYMSHFGLSLVAIGCLCNYFIL